MVCLQSCPQRLDDMLFLDFPSLLITLEIIVHESQEVFFTFSLNLSSLSYIKKIFTKPFIINRCRVFCPLGKQTFG